MGSTRSAELRRVSLAAGVLVALAACGPKPPARQLTFARTPAFHEISGKVYAILERDLDGDGWIDAVIAERQDHGYSIVVMEQVPPKQEGQQEYRRRCTGPLLTGEDLDAFNWVPLGPRDAVFARVLQQDPEELRQSIAVVDVAKDCDPLFAEEVRLTAGDAQTVVSSPALSGGAFLEEPSAVHIVDRPRYLRLAGAEADVQVLTGARLRIVRFDAAGAHLEEGTVEALEPLPLTGALYVSEVRDDGLTTPPPEPTPPPPTAPEPPTPEPTPPTKSEIGGLTDGEDGLAVELDPDADPLLMVKATAPIVLLEVHHGCEQPGPGLELVRLDEEPGREVHVLGARPKEDSFVQASSLEGAKATGRALLLLRAPTALLQLHVGPRAGRRCLRELKAFGWRGASDDEPDAPGPTSAPAEPTSALTPPATHR